MGAKRTDKEEEADGYTFQSGQLTIDRRRAFDALIQVVDCYNAHDGSAKAWQGNKKEKG